MAMLRNALKLLFKEVSLMLVSRTDIYAVQAMSLVSMVKSLTVNAT